MKNKTKAITVHLTGEQYEFLVHWQKNMEMELGKDVPLGAIASRIIDRFIVDHHSGGNQRDPRGSKSHDGGSLHKS